MITLDSLSPRQREIAKLVAEGLSYSEVARRLLSKRSIRGGTIRPRTVRAHVAQIAARIDGTDERQSSPQMRVMRWVLSQRASEN